MKSLLSLKPFSKVSLYATKFEIALSTISSSGIFLLDLVAISLIVDIEEIIFLYPL